MTVGVAPDARCVGALWYGNMKGIGLSRGDPAGIEQGIRYLKRFSPDDLIEFRAIRTGDVRRFWITPEQYAGLHPDLIQMDSTGYDIYAGVNPRSRRGSDESAVATVVAFHVDLDCARFAGKNTQEERAETSIPLPSLVVSSGHGCHLYWYAAEPIPVTDANRHYLKGINRGLALAVGGDPACCDLARILRVPGFTNHKPPAAPVRIIATNDVTYTVAEMARWAVAPSEDPSDPHPMPQVSGISLPLKLRFDQFRAQDKSGETTRAWRGQVGDGSSDSRFVLARKLSGGGCFTPDEVVTIICSRRWFNRHARREKSPEAVRRDAVRLVQEWR